MCAVHLALAAGAVVYGTASTPEKRAYLESLGVRGTFHSRDLGFVEGVRRATGAGVGPPCPRVDEQTCQP